MAEYHEISARDRRRRDRSIWRTGLLVSVLFHLLVLFGWRGSVLPDSPFAAAGPAAGDARAAAGSMQAMNVRTPPPRPIVPPRTPLPTEVAIEPVQFDEMVELEPTSVLGDEPGELEAPGIETGTGQGDGGNSDEGLYRLQPPVPRGMIMPPLDRRLRGSEVRVWVFVNEAGRVVPDSTRLEPRTGHGDLDRLLIREAADWVFHPAEEEGRAVASWFPYTIGM